MKKAVVVVVKALMFDFKKNYFQLFELPISFNVDEALLKKHYLIILQQIHPDRFVNATEQEKRLAVQYTGYVNEAFATLRETTKRAAYLLKIQGVEINFETNTVMDEDFLIEQLQWREKMANATEAQFTQIKEELNVEKKKIIKGLEESFFDKDLEKARKLTLKLKFYDKF